MSVFKNRADLRLARRTKALLTRGASTIEALRKLGRQEQEIAALRAVLPAKREAGEDVGIRPENIIWVFGSGRTGSSWLTFMMGALPDHTRWNEPLIGHLLGHLYYDERDDARAILGNDYGETWLSSTPSLVLNGATAGFPEAVGPDKYLVIKEPNGSIGARSS